MTSLASPASAAGTWQLGDLTVNRLGLGAMRLTGSLPFGKGTPSDRSRSIAVLRRAVELGVNHIDTASFYFSALRSANELINTALYPYPDDLVIVTKVSPGRDPSGEWYSARPDQLRGQVEENLRQLGRDYMDVVNLRRRPSQESVAEHFGALAELRDAGLIRHLGVSDVTVAQLEEVLAIAPVVCVQNRYNLDDRTHDPVLRACADKGIAFVPFFAVSGDRRQSGGAGTESASPTWRRTSPPRPSASATTTWHCSTRDNAARPAITLRAGPSRSGMLVIHASSADPRRRSVRRRPLCLRVRRGRPIGRACLRCGRVPARPGREGCRPW
ncbi:MAG: aldo/keto reductase [Trebonia sp.]